MVLVCLKNLLFPRGTPQTGAECNASTPLRDHGLRHVDNYGSTLTVESPLIPNDRSTSLLPDKIEEEVSSSNSGDGRPYFSRIDPRVISDATIGLSDGLTVPFALTAGLSALGDSKVVIAGGLAELIAGAISMGLGGWLAAKSEADAYRTLLCSTRELVRNDPDHAAELLRDSLAPLSQFMKLECLNSDGFARVAMAKQNVCSTISDMPDDSSLNSDAESFIAGDTQLTQLLMRYHHCSPSAPSQARALISALTIATAYFCGGFVPLLPYFFASEVGVAFWWSVGVMAIALGCFGAGKTWLISGSSNDGMDMNREDNQGSREPVTSRRRRSWRTLFEIVMGGVQMIFLGGFAAAAAMGLVIAFDLP